MKRSNKTILAAALAAAVLFAGCSSSNSGRRSDSGRNSENEAAREVAIETTAAAGELSQPVAVAVRAKEAQLQYRAQTS